jgi:CRP-like cAMP-binding protein
MTLVEKLFALKRTPCFEGLQESDLILIASAATEHSYEPGEQVCSAGRTLNNLFVVIDGAVHDSAGREVFPLIGVPSLLFDYPVHSRLTASTDAGARCLVLNKGHFFAIVNQCPSLVISLRSLPRETLGVSEEAGIE